MADTASKVAKDNSEQSGGKTAKSGGENPLQNNNRKDNELNGPQLSTSGQAIPATTATGGDTTKVLMPQPEIEMTQAVSKLQSKLKEDHPDVTVEAKLSDGKVIREFQPQPPYDPETQRPVSEVALPGPLSQLDPTRHVNQQNPATLLAPDSAPESHKTYHFELPNLGRSQDTLLGTKSEIATATDKTSGDGQDAGDWTQSGDGTQYPR